MSPLYVPRYPRPPWLLRPLPLAGGITPLGLFLAFLSGIVLVVGAISIVLVIAAAFGRTE